MPKEVRDGPKAVVVAHASVEGAVEVEAKEKGPVRVAPGQPLHIKLTYRLREASRDEEQYRFELVTRLAEGKPVVASARWGDVWGVPEDIQGFVVTEYAPKRAGRHELIWEATAEYGVKGWAANGETKITRGIRKGVIDIVVEGRN